jgi:hypothetical protein
LDGFGKSHQVVVVEVSEQPIEEIEGILVVAVDELYGEVGIDLQTSIGISDCFVVHI